MNAPATDWPPIIRSAKRSRLLVWRDALLTALMWGLLFLILYSELAFAMAALDVLLGRSDAEIDAEIDQFIRHMRPLLWIVGGLVLMLAIATVASRQRRQEALLAAQPTPLDNAEIAAIAGLDEAGLIAAWQIKRAVVARKDGGLAVKAALPPETSASAGRE